MRLKPPAILKLKPKEVLEKVLQTPMLGVKTGMIMMGICESFCCEYNCSAAGRKARCPKHRGWISIRAYRKSRYMA